MAASLAEQKTDSPRTRLSDWPISLLRFVDLISLVGNVRGRRSANGAGAGRRPPPHLGGPNLGTAGP